MYNFHKEYNFSCIVKNAFLPDTLESKATHVSQEEVVKKQRGRQTGMQTQNKGENGYKKELGKGMYLERSKLKIFLREDDKEFL